MGGSLLITHGGTLIFTSISLRNFSFFPKKIPSPIFYSCPIKTSPSLKMIANSLFYGVVEFYYFYKGKNKQFHNFKKGKKNQEAYYFVEVKDSHCTKNQLNPIERVFKYNNILCCI